MALTANTLDRSPGMPAAGSQRMVLAREEWARALNGFTRRHDGWLVSLDVCPLTGERQREFENLPLLGVSSDRLDPNGTLAISVSRSRVQHLTHIIHAVEQVSVVQTADGAEAALWIDAADGSRTVMRFRVPAPPETVDGLAR